MPWREEGDQRVGPVAPHAPPTDSAPAALASGTLPEDNLQTLQWYTCMGLETETNKSDSTKGPENHDEETQRA